MEGKKLRGMSEINPLHDTIHEFLFVKFHHLQESELRGLDEILHEVEIVDQQLDIRVNIAMEENSSLSALSRY